MSRHGSKNKPRQAVKSLIFIAYPHPGMVHHVFFESVLNVAMNPTRGYHLTFAHARSGPLISRARNMLSEHFMAEEKATHLLFIDTDMHFEQDSIQTLLDADKAIVSGLCYGMKPDQPETFVAALDYDEKNMLVPVAKEKLPKSGCFKVDAVGMAFTLIKREVIEKLKPDNVKLWPFAESIQNGRAVGEDVTFCLRAKEHGFTSWVCVDARIGHEKEIMI